MKEKNGEHPFGDAGQLICLGAFLAVWPADSFYFSWSTFLSGGFPLTLRLGLLALSLILGLYLFGSAHKVTDTDKRPPGVLRSGAFRYVRHPLYLASMLFYAGLAVSTFSLLSLLLLLPIFAFYNHIARYEERLLEEKFGENYTLYRTTTGRWVPKLHPPNS